MDAPRLAGTDPESNPTLQRLIAEAQASRPRAPLSRERWVELSVAALFLGTAVAMAVLFTPPRSLDVGLAVVLVLVYAVVARVEFQTGPGWALPTELVFVPMLFLLPTPAVPLFVAAALLLARVPDYLSGAVRPARALSAPGDAWYAIGPALVLTATGATSPEWADWPIYLAALASQFGIDLLASTIRMSVGVGVPPRTVVVELGAVWLIDALLAPIGLLAAFASVEEQWAFLLVLPLVGLIAVFAREREARIENALELSHAYRGTAHLLTDMLTADHEYTGSHSRSVIELARGVGVKLEFDEVMLRDLEFAALLHDIGKVTVPNEIINKPGPLTDEEWAIMRTHTMEGERMLKQVGGVLGEAGSIVRSHHEHFDGKGYPDGLIGEEIPIAARVISCCDAFNAMTTDRAYRKAMPLADAIAELTGNSGTQFDPAVVEAVLEIVTRELPPPEPAAPTAEPQPEATRSAVA
jgi:HD-GYP domain-containing protein (c-di-GMP phosphodiesterase class II)